MKLPRDVAGRQLVKALRELGYVETRRKGSHIRVNANERGTPRSHPRSRPHQMWNVEQHSQKRGQTSRTDSGRIVDPAQSVKSAPEPGGQFIW